MALAPTKILNNLQHATEGLTMPSETEASFESFFWPADPNADIEEAVTSHCGEDAAATLETMDIEEFLEEAAAAEDWMDTREKATARRFAELIDLLEDSLEGAQAYLCGRRQRTVFLVGRVPGGIAGLKTKVVET